MQELRDSTVRTNVDTASIYMRQVYQWMGAGLALTAICSAFVASSETLFNVLMGNTVSMIIMAVAVIGLPMVISGMISRLSAAAATGLFLLYSALMGVFLSSIFLVYTSTSIFSTFLTTAGTFFAMSVYGTVTKRDLTAMGSFLMMGLFGIIIAMVVNIFLQSSLMATVISAIGVLIFTGLTAYDTQRIRAFGEDAPLGDAAAMRRGALLGALTLYLDFINLFLMLLRFMGDRR